MSEVTLTVKGYQFNHLQENATAQKALLCAKHDADKRFKGAMFLLFAAVFDGASAFYYSGSTVLGTVKRFPTQGKKEAKEFLVEEGWKALCTAIYAGTTALLSVAALFKAHWALSHIEVANCPPDRRQPPEGGEAEAQLQAWNRAVTAALLQKDTDFQTEFLKIKGALEREEQNESTAVLCPINYWQVFMKKYQADFADPANADLVLQGMKKVLAAIAFMRNLEDVARLVTTEYDAIPQEIIDMKIAANADAEAKRKENELQSEEARLLREEQDREFQEQLEIQRRRDAERARIEQERLQKEEQEEALTARREELDGLLESLSPVQEAFNPVAKALQSNWQNTQIKTKGVVKYSATEMYRFVTTRLGAVNLEGLDLTKREKPEPLPEDLRETHPRAEQRFFEELESSHQALTKAIDEINQFVDYATLMQLVQSFPKEEIGAEEQARLGQQVIDLVSV